MTPTANIQPHGISHRSLMGGHTTHRERRDRTGNRADFAKWTCMLGNDPNMTEITGGVMAQVL